MAQKMSGKQIGLTVLMGSAVVVLTPLIANLLPASTFLSVELIPNYLSVATTVSAGIAAFVSEFAIAKWIR